MIMKKNAFTLSEVLITLAVVGIIAAITLPSVINKYKEQETVSKVKKFYSTMSQAYMLSVKDNSYPNEWHVGNRYTSKVAKQIATYLKPYLKISKDCGVNSGCLNYKKNIKLLKGSSHTQNYDTSPNYYKIILSDGSYIWWRGSDDTWCDSIKGEISNVCVIMWTDINGGKEPNTLGKDIFYGFITIGGVKSTYTNDDCNLNGNGWSCLNYILQNGNMDYLHK